MSADGGVALVAIAGSSELVQVDASSLVLVVEAPRPLLVEDVDDSIALVTTTDVGLIQTDRESFVLVRDDPASVVIESRVIALPGSGSGLYLDFPMLTASNVWIINHNFGVRPAVQVLSPGLVVSLPAVSHQTVNQVRLDFTSAQAGRAILTA